MSDFWAKKLGTPVPASRDQGMPMPPSQIPLIQQPSSQSQTIGRRIPSDTQVDKCPDCNSTNYMSVQGAKARCLDCGYPLEQSGSKYGALTGAKVTGNVKESRGNDKTNNYNPHTIIGKIDG